MCDVEIAVQNTTKRPLRVSNLEIMVLDKEDFAKRPTKPLSDLTVPPESKEKLTVSFNLAADQLSKVRIWGVEQDLGSARKVP